MKFLRKYSLSKRINLLTASIMGPLTVLVLYLLVNMINFSTAYNQSVKNITVIKDYSLNFKTDLDYSIYRAIVGNLALDDLDEYAKNRQLIYEIVTGCGFEAVRPDGAFYLFVKSPSGDGKEFSERAKKYELLLVPSDSFGIEGYVRISYCVARKQIERSEEAFRALAADYGLL